MPARLLSWPNWPEFTSAKGESNPDLITYKQEIASKYGEAALTRSWLRVCKELESLTSSIACSGSESIPEVPFADFFTISAAQKQQFKDTGCFVVRGVINRTQATEWFEDLKQYVAANRPKIGGWPAATPFILNLYFSPTQMKARSHPNQLKLSRELNSWWHDSSSDSESSTSEPLSYADGVRIRPPGVPFLGLGPHIDAGSLSRWVDPTYQSVYDAVFSGQPETLDNYDLSRRQHAKQAKFTGSAHSRVFRSFQGWTALTGAGPGDGSLMLYPNVKWAIAYVLLRPFFTPPSNDADLLDASQWTFNISTPWFPGTFREDSQLLSPSSHPHLRLQECMVSIPRMYPGDTIWWHADVCHAVEVEHAGAEDASVAYIAATPSTEVNKRYVKAQLADFLAGVPPEDFRRGSCEREFVGFQGEEAILSGVEGRRAMGFGLV